jgi:hypothetical protein
MSFTLISERMSGLSPSGTASIRRHILKASQSELYCLFQSNHCLIIQSFAHV